MWRLRILSRNLLLLVLLALLDITSARPSSKRDEDPFSAISTVDLKKFTAPNPAMVLSEFNGMGDSFTSGPGTGDIDPYSQQCTRYSNAYVRQMNENEDLGMPGNKENRYLTHSACFGAKTDDITLFQTIPGDRDHRADHPRFGKPQLAVLTLGGNNVGFSGIVNNCLFQMWPTKTCPQQVEESRKLIDAVDIELDIAKTLIEIIRVGQKSKGADPPESFQIHVVPYVGFFNQDTTPCNDRTFGGGFPTWPGYPRVYLTKELRRDLNDMTDALNAKIRKAVNAFKDFGVFYAGDYGAAFNGHRYCENEHPGEDFTDSHIWFFHIDSPLHDEKSGAPAKAEDRWKEFLAVALRPKDSTTTDLNELLKNGINPDIKTDDDVFNALANVTNPPKPDPDMAPWPIQWKRSMHPKKDGYTAMARQGIISIQAHVPQVSCSEYSKTGADSGVIIKGLVPKFCQDLSKEKMVQVEGQVQHSFTFTKGSGEGSCDAQTCQAAYDTAMKTCQYDSHTIRQNGNIRLACGTFAWELNAAPEAPGSSGSSPAATSTKAAPPAASSCDIDSSPFASCAPE